MNATKRQPGALLAEPSKCLRCIAGPIRQTYRFEVDGGFGFYVWDIDKAIAAVSQNRNQREQLGFDPAILADGISRNEIDRTHLDHVNPSIPGIIAQAWQPDIQLPRFTLIDGNHRAARCLRDGLPFFAFWLTDEESQGCLLEQPERTAWMDKLFRAHAGFAEV